MNWNLIFKLSLFGLAMAIATVFVIPSTIEPFFWLVIFALCAYIIAVKSRGRYFLHGFRVSRVNCVWITGMHILFAKQYLSLHPQEAAMTAKMPFAHSPRLMMLMVGPVIGIVSGAVLGLFSVVAGKLTRTAVAPMP
jgi:hypothetical protein